jgi:membrane protein implicated in regulation of membrane protease activity
MESLFLSWPWLWFIAGGLLLGLEIILSTVALLFFAFGAFAAGLMACGGVGLNWQLLIFIIVSLASMVFLRKKCKLWLQKSDRQISNDFIGSKATVINSITPEIPGKVELNGVEWRAVSMQTLKPGQLVRIKSQDGLTLVVESAADGE